MSQQYNSKLIDKLYREANPENATRIADEMVEIGDAIFVYPILTAYNKFRGKFYDHFFISDLMQFKKDEATEVLKELCHDKSLSETECLYLAGFCINNNYIDQAFSEKIEGFFSDVFDSGVSNIDDFDIEVYLDYLIFTKRFGDFENKIMSIFSEAEDNKTVSAKALKYLLKYDASKYLQYYYENYELIKNKSAEIVFAKEISGWSKGILPKIRDKILSEGSSRAKEIVAEKIKNEQEKEEEKKIEIAKKNEYKFGNTEIVAEIVDFRKKINSLSLSKLDFQIFNSAELIFEQCTPAETERDLIGCCMTLRGVVQGISDKVSEHGYCEEDAKKMIPGLNANGSINNLHLYLMSKGYNIDIDLGLRTVNAIVSKLAHITDDKSDLFKILKESDLYFLYSSEEWGQLHKAILKRYAKTLDQFLVCLQIKP